MRVSTSLGCGVRAMKSLHMNTRVPVLRTCRKPSHHHACRAAGGPQIGNRAGGGTEKLIGARTDHCGGQEGVTAQCCLLSGARGAAKRRTSHSTEPRCPHPPGCGKMKKRNRANGPHSLQAPWIPAPCTRGTRDQSQEALRSLFILESVCESSIFLLANSPSKPPANPHRLLPHRPQLRAGVLT